MKKKGIEIHIGPLTIDGKTVAAGIFTIVVVAGLVVGKTVLERKKTAKQEEAAAQASAPVQRVFASSEITGGNYYIKNGDDFYPLAAGCLYSSADKDTAIAKKADPANRMLMFGTDDTTVPTMYSDCSLVYKAQDGEAIPETFVLERFQDNGWSAGVHGLSQVTGGNLKLTVDSSSFYPGSSISFINAKAGNELIFDKIDGLPFGNNILSSVGTINGLEKDKSYKLDAYVGTNYVGMDVTADTHIFISMERYELTEYSLDPSGYMVVSFPHDLWSGYYYVNGLGLFRYINQPKSMGDTVTEFNELYYVTDAAGNEIIHPANGYGITDNDTTWDYEIPVRKDTSVLNVAVTYQGSKATGTPDAKLIAPDGGEYPLSLSTDGSNVLEAKTEFPESGVWTISMSDMGSRVFDVSVSFGEEVEGSVTISKTTDEKVETVINLPELQDGTLTFTWDNTDYAGNFLVIGPDGEQFGNTETPELVDEANYGRVTLHPGYLTEGSYKVYVTGKALGNIALSYEEHGTPATQDETVQGETNPDSETPAETEAAE